VKIRDAFEAPEGYIILEADYSQMEVACLAAASGCALLQAEVREGVDLHTRNAAKWRRVSEDLVTKADRKTAKIMTFQLAYGASGPRMAKDFGLPKKETAAFIKAFEKKYSRVTKWWDEQDAIVNANIQVNPRGGMGTPEYRSELATSYGKRYIFLATDTKRDYKTHKTTQQVGARFIKNYPVQGVAADLLKMAQGALWRERTELVRLGATPMIPIHDSLYFKFDRSYDLEEFLEFLDYRMTQVPVQTLNRLAGYEWWPTDLPLRIDIKTGKKWSEMKEYVRN